LYAKYVCKTKAVFYFSWHSIIAKIKVVFVEIYLIAAFLNG